MKQATLAKLAAAATAAALLATSSVAFAQTYDTGGPDSGSAGTIVPGNNLNTPGVTDPNGVGATGTPTGTAQDTNNGTGTPGIPNTGGTGTTSGTDDMTPGVPNTGIGESMTLALALSGLVAAGAGAYLMRRRFAL